MKKISWTLIFVLIVAIILGNYFSYKKQKAIVPAIHSSMQTTPPIKVWPCALPNCKG